jgi:hypothetical protein
LHLALGIHIGAGGLRYAGIRVSLAAFMQFRPMNGTRREYHAMTESFANPFVFAMDIHLR